MGIIKNIINFFYMPRMKIGKHFNMGLILTNQNSTKAITSIYNIDFDVSNGRKSTLNIYRGKKILIVNTASKCGYTPQYRQLQEMHEQMHEKIQIIAFPCNNFGTQEPGNDDEILNFCTANYGVTFPLFKKINVIGNEAAPIYKWLTDKNLNGWNEQAPEWNFCKYLIDEEGNLIAFYSQHVEPASNEILTKIALI